MKKIIVFVLSLSLVLSLLVVPSFASEDVPSEYDSFIPTYDVIYFMKNDNLYLYEFNSRYWDYVSIDTDNMLLTFHGNESQNFRTIKQWQYFGEWDVVNEFNIGTTKIVSIDTLFYSSIPIFDENGNQYYPTLEKDIYQGLSIDEFPSKISNVMFTVTSVAVGVLALYICVVLLSKKFRYLTTK